MSSSSTGRLIKLLLLLLLLPRSSRSPRSLHRQLPGDRGAHSGNVSRRPEGLENITDGVEVVIPGAGRSTDEE